MPLVPKAASVRSSSALFGPCGPWLHALIMRRVDHPLGIESPRLRPLTTGLLPHSTLALPQALLGGGEVIYILDSD